MVRCESNPVAYAPGTDWRVASSPDPATAEARSLDGLSIEDVATIDKYIARHDRSQPREVDTREFVPFGDEHNGIATRRKVLHRFGVDEVQVESPTSV